MTKKDYVLLAVILILFSLLFWRQNNIETKADNNKQTMDSLKQTEEKLKKKVDSVDEKIDGTKTVINNIHREKEIRIKFVERMSNKEMEQYFKDRYGEK